MSGRSRFTSVTALACALMGATIVASCGMGGGAALGTKDNPIKMAFVPSSDSQKVLSVGEPLGQLLENETGYAFKVSVPTNYAAVIEAMGAKNVDVGWLATFAYVLARDKFGAEAVLATVRQGSKTYTGEISFTRIAVSIASSSSGARSSPLWTLVAHRDTCIPTLYSNRRSLITATILW